MPAFLNLSTPSHHHYTRDARRKAAASPALLQHLPEGERQAAVRALQQPLGARRWQLLGLAAASADWRSGAPLPLPALCQLTPHGDVAVRLLYDHAPPDEALAQHPAVLLPAAAGAAAAPRDAAEVAAAAAAEATARGKLPWVRGVPPLAVQRVAAGEAERCGTCAGCRRLAKLLEEEHRTGRPYPSGQSHHTACTTVATLRRAGLAPSRFGWRLPAEDTALMTVPTGPGSEWGYGRGPVRGGVLSVPLVAAPARTGAVGRP